MLIGGVAVVVSVVAVALVVAVVAAVALFARRAQDDAHSVEHYHRQLHTLEEIRSHPSVGGGAGAGLGGAAEEDGTSTEADPASTFRVSGSRTVRLTDLETPTVPPAPPPAVPNPAEPVRFDDTGAPIVPDADREGLPEAPRPSFLGGNDKAMHSIDRRPRRLGGPLAAIGVVTVLIVVLIVTGLHSNTTPPRKGSSTPTTTTAVHASTTVPAHGATPPAGRGHHGRVATTSTTTTAPPVVSAATAATAHGATYDVTAGTYTLSLAASSGECWVQAQNPATGSILFSGTLFSGQSHIVSATGPVAVIAGAPGDFAATVDGVPVTLPQGSLAPFTLTFQPPAAAGGGSTTPTT